MLLMLLSIWVGGLAAAVLVSTMAGTGASQHGSLRLAALDRELAAADDPEKVTDIRKAHRRLSAIPWLNHWLTTLNLAPVSSLYLYQAGVTLTLGTLILSSIVGFSFLAYLLHLRLGAAFPALLLAAGFLPLPFLYVRHRRTKRLCELERQLPEALGMMVGALRVGHSLIASLGAVAQDCSEPIAGEIRKCFEENNYGVDLRTALGNLAERVPVQDFRIFVAAVLIQKETGGNLAEVLENVAETTRERFRLKRQVSVHTAQGRMTGWILSLLPVALGLVMYFVNPDGTSVLWKRPIGLTLLYTAIAMDIAGALIIRKIVSIRV